MLNLKIIIAGAILLIGVSIGYGISDMLHVKRLKAELKAERAEVGRLSAYLNSTIESNANNTKIFEAEKLSFQKTIKACENRVAINKKDCNELIRILSLQGGNPDEKPMVGSSGDDIINLRNILWRQP